MRPGSRSRAPGSRSWGRRPSARRTNRVFTIGTAETDARGRWRLDVAPKDLSDLSVHPKHPRYMQRPGERIAEPRRRDRPHAGADGDRAGRRCRRPAGQGGEGPARQQIRQVSVPVGTTDDRGAFTLEHCEAGPTTVTVQAEGYAPGSRTSRSRRGPSPWSSRSRSGPRPSAAGSSNVEGKPVAGAIVGADTWRGRRSLEFRVTTGADGRFEWRGAPQGRRHLRRLQARLHVEPTGPADRVGSRAGHHAPPRAGHHRPRDRRRDGPAGAGIPPGPRPEVSGVAPRCDWAENEAVEVAGGRYTTRFDEPMRGLRPAGRGPGLSAGRVARLPVEPRGARPSTSPSCAAGDCPGSSCSPTASRPRVPRSCSRPRSWATS